MKKTNFVSPHVHVQSLDSASTPEDFLKRELELGTGSMVCTDHGFLGACREVYSLAKKNSLVPILGIEAYHRDDDCQIIKSSGIEKVSEYYKYGHLLIHARDQAAYEALIKKVSDRDLTAEQHGSERKPIFSWSDLEELSHHNCTFSSGCLVGIVSRHLMSDRPDLAVKYYEKIRSIAGKDKFIVELFPHKCDKNWVSGVFITLKNGKQLKYYLGKKVRTETFDEIKVVDLAKEFLKNKVSDKIIGVKNGSTWETLEPSEIASVNLVQDFLPNECRPWAPDGDVQMGANRFVIELAKKYGDKILISDDAHYASSDLKIVQDAKLGGMGDSFRFYGSYHRQDSGEAFSLLNKELGISERDFDEYVNNSIEWRDSFKDFKLDQKISLPKSFYPEDTVAHFWELVKKHGRYNDSPVYKERIEKELELIHKNGTIDLLPYFFLAEDSCEAYSKAGRLNGPGRGSASGLLMNYYLNVTHIDPIKHDLSLDRFLTHDRVASGRLPDIDMDFSDRDVAIGFIKEKFGENVAQISTRNLLRLKSALKDVSRFTWGHITPEIESLCETIPSTPQGVEDLRFLFGYTDDSGEEVKGYFYQNEGLQRFAKECPKQWEIVLKILKVTRSLGRHASAIVVADKPIDSFIPLITISGERATQYTAGSCEDAGAVKMDYLTVNALKDIEQTLEILREENKIDPSIKEYTLNGKKVPAHRVIKHAGNFYDIWDLPDLPEVYEQIVNMDVETIFQLGTNSARKGLKSFQGRKVDGTDLISNKEDGALFIALNRPGPLDAVVSDENSSRNMLQEYAARARGSKPIGEIQYLSNELSETFGVIVYQEHLTKIYKKLSGCSGIEAEAFRSDIGKKKLDKVEARKPMFIENASKLVGAEVAEDVWDQIVTFGQYGFNKSHAISYFYLSYATAFLKHFYPLQWWCGVLRDANKEKIEQFWPYCKQYVVLPDIQFSTGNFYIKDGKIIAPLSIIKGLGEKAHTELVGNSPYKNIEDFVQKIAKTKKTTFTTEDGQIKTKRSNLNNSGVIGKLILSGVMDSLFPPGMNTVEKLEFFNLKMAEALGKKRPEKINQKYAITNPLDIYQIRKDFLAVYSKYLAPDLYLCRTHGVQKKTVGVKDYYIYYPEDPKVLSTIISQGVEKIKPMPFLDGKTFYELNTQASIETGKVLRVAVAAFVVDEDRFSYKQKDKQKKETGIILHAKKYVLDIDGVTKEFVKWPEYESPYKLKALKEKTLGSVVIAILSKRKELTDFNIDAIIPVHTSKLEDD